MWPREAKLKAEARHAYPTVREGWTAVLFVGEDGVWLETIRDRPVVVPLHCVEVRGEQPIQEDGDDA
jgi:hypothetical protein